MESYGYEPSPNDSPRDGSLHPIAQQDLIIWQTWAMHMPTETTDDGYLRCGWCTQAVARLRDRAGRYYEMGPEVILALKVAHMRQVHEDYLAVE